jgi:hypothetical protein
MLLLGAALVWYALSIEVATLANMLSGTSLFSMQLEKHRVSRFGCDSDSHLLSAYNICQRTIFLGRLLERMRLCVSVWECGET